MIHATVIGNLGGDAELKVVGQNNNSVCNFSIATKGRKKDGPTTWVRAAMWGTRAEKVAPYLKKGGRVAAVGTITTREHDGKTYVELDVSELELLGDKPAAQSASASEYAGGKDDQIPF
jgi:single-strand DNA-binding protein